MNNANKVFKIDKKKIFISYFIGFFIANMIPKKYFTLMMRTNYDMIFSNIKIVEYDKYYKIY